MEAAILGFNSRRPSIAVHSPAGLSLRAAVALKRLEEFGQGQSEGGHKSIEGGNADITFTALDRPDIVPVQVGTLGQYLLRESTPNS
jgi:hypothetical protein